MTTTNIDALQAQVTAAYQDLADAKEARFAIGRKSAKTRDAITANEAQVSSAKTEWARLLGLLCTARRRVAQAERTYRPDGTGIGSNVADVFPTAA